MVLDGTNKGKGTKNGFLSKHDRDQNLKEGKHFEYDECDYSTNDKSHLVRHVKAVDDRIRNRKFSEYGHAFNQKRNLDVHIKAVHNLTYNKYHTSSKHPYMKWSEL